MKESVHLWTIWVTAAEETLQSPLNAKKKKKKILEGTDAPEGNVWFPERNLSRVFHWFVCVQESPGAPAYTFPSVRSEPLICSVVCRVWVSVRKKQKTTKQNNKKAKAILQLTYLHRAGESPRRQPPKGGIHPEKVPRKNNNPHGFPFPSIPSETVERHRERRWWCGGGRDAREASEKRKKKEEEKKRGRKEERWERFIFPRFLVPAVFLFHGGLVGFFPCSVSTRERAVLVAAAAAAVEVEVEVVCRAHM